MANQVLGKYGESLAREYLQKLGFKILEQNFRTRLGEIDLIAKDGQTVCFIEVKMRVSLKQGEPYEAITVSKIRKLSQMAMIYLKFKYHTLEILSRFDVISIVQGENQKPEIQHIKNAFDSLL
ncbi:MAG: YraN family protein [Candidatus Omnitrophica bacterium]|nr:YraN family protein [Candidatus Omnitrophota bacterium]